VASGRRAAGTGQGGGEQTARSGGRAGRRRADGAQRGQNKGSGEQTVRSGDRTRAAASRRRAAGTGQGRRRADGAQRGQDKGGGKLTACSGAEKGCGTESVILLLRELRKQVVA